MIDCVDEGKDFDQLRPFKLTETMKEVFGNLKEARKMWDRDLLVYATRSVEACTADRMAWRYAHLPPSCPAWV